jgi:cytochrome b561
MSPYDRYTRTAIALHWLIAVVVIAQFAWGWGMQGIAKEPSGPRADAFNLHKSIGLTLLALMTLRLLWRWRNPPPPMPTMPVWQARLARVNHVLLYAALFTMPLAGYLGSVFSGYPVKYFGMTLPAWAWKDSALKDLCSTIHFVMSWVLASAVTLHVAAALKHALFDRDQLLARMGIGTLRK